jgi:hypothetical protein
MHLLGAKKTLRRVFVSDERLSKCRCKDSQDGAAARL